MCAVSNRFVENIRPKSGVNGSHLERTGADGKSYPATHITQPKRKKETAPIDTDDELLADEDDGDETADLAF